jgi:hypothetical protein
MRLAQCLEVWDAEEDEKAKPGWDGRTDKSTCKAKFFCF